MTIAHNEEATRAFRLAQQCLEEGDIPRACGLLQEIVSADPSYEAAWEELAGALPALGNPAEPERLFAAARQHKIKSGRFWSALARSLSGPTAREAYRMALQANPDDEQSLLELAWSFRAAGDKESANKLYRYLLEVYARRRDWRSLNSLGDTLRRLVGNLDDAEAALRKSLEVNPDYFDAWKNLTYLMCSRRDPAGAQQVMRRFIQTYPQHPQLAEAWVCLGNVLRSCDDLTGAEEAVRQAIAVDVRCQSGWSKLADLRFEQGDFDGGQEALEQANKLDYNTRFD